MVRKAVVFMLELALLGGAGAIAANRAIGGLVNRPAGCCVADAGVSDGGARR